MATQNTIASTLGWVAGSNLNRPTQNVAGFLYEPALTSANWVMSVILGPPFAWQWNRSTASFTTVAGQSDYQVNLPTYGWLEKATATNSNFTPPVFELQIDTLKAASGKNNVPYWISPVFDNNAGQITFRLMPIPDQTYTVTLTYQNAPIFATALYTILGTIGGIGPVVNTGITSYSSTSITGGAGNGLVNQYLYFSGAANPANNGIYLCNLSTANDVNVLNPNGVTQSGSGGLIQSVTTWAPIPDKYNFLYETGLRAQLYTIYDRSAYLTEMQMFYRSLVGCSEGLSDTAKAIFLEDKLTQLRTEAAAQAASTGSPRKGQ